MARKLLEKYLNHLDIKKGEFLEKQLKEYKFARLQRSLEILNRASYCQAIPDEIIDEIEMIFTLMPVHELYYIKVNEQEFKEYIERLNRLYIKVLDDYESYTEIISPDSWKIISASFYVTILFHKSIEKWFGFYAIPAVLGCLLIFWIYENRWRVRKGNFNFSKRLFKS